MDDVEAGANEAARRSPLLSVSNNDTVAPEIFGNMIAKWLDTEILEEDRLVVLHDLRVDGVIDRRPERMTFPGFTFERLEE
jgi:hypothetical protein